MGVDRLDCCLPLHGRGAVVGGLWTASGFIAFALVVLVWPVAGFLTASGPSEIALA